MAEGGDDNGLFVALLCHIRLPSSLPSLVSLEIMVARRDVVSMDSERASERHNLSTRPIRRRRALLSRSKAAKHNVLPPPTHAPDFVFVHTSRMVRVIQTKKRVSKCRARDSMGK